MPLHKKDFFGLRGMSADDIRYILGTAETMKYILNQKDKKTPHLRCLSLIYSLLRHDDEASYLLMVRGYETASHDLIGRAVDN